MKNKHKGKVLVDYMSFLLFHYGSGYFSRGAEINLKRPVGLQVSKSDYCQYTVYVSICVCVHGKLEHPCFVDQDMWHYRVFIAPPGDRYIAFLYPDYRYFSGLTEEFVVNLWMRVGTFFGSGTVCWRCRQFFLHYKGQEIISHVPGW